MKFKFKTSVLFLLLLGMFFQIGYSQESISIDSLKQLLISENEAKKLDKIYSEIVLEYQFIIPDSAILYCNYGLENGLENKDNADIAYYNNFLGSLYKSKACYDSAIIYFDKAISYYYQADFERGAAGALNNLGQAQRYKGDYDQALNSFYSSLEIFERHQDTLNIGELHSNIGALLLEIDEYDAAEEHFLISKRQYQLASATIRIAWIYYDLGNLKLKTNKAKEAKQNFNKALIIWDEYNRINAYNNCILGICNADILLGNYSIVLKKLDEAKKQFEQIENMQAVAQCLLLKGKAEFGLKNYQSANKYLFESLEIIKPIKSTQVEMDIYHELYNSYFELEDYKTAIIYQKKHIELKDSIFSKDKHKLMVEFQTKLNLANKEYFIKQLEDSTRQQQVINNLITQENQTKQNSIYMLIGVLGIILILIYIIYRRNVKYTVLNKELQESLKERETLIREVHHRVKNNLQIISSLLNLQSEQVSSDKESQVLKISQSRVEAMSMIHENLYKSDKISNIDFSNYVNGLCSYMKTSFDLEASNIEIITDIPPISIDIDKLVPCGLILTELVTNSIKHAFTNASDNVIKISCFINNESVKLVIHDNGNGVSDNFDFQKSQSLGLRLVSGLTRQIRSELKYENDNGFKVWFEFKLEE